MIDISQTYVLIEDHGSRLERARFQHILYGIMPEQAIIQPFTSLQNKDGGFPYDMVEGNLSTVDNTLNALWWLDELGLSASSTSENAFKYLMVVQMEDGGWDENPAITKYDLPPWSSPGTLATRLYLSSYAVYWLIINEYAPQFNIKKALDFLAQHQDETGKFHGFLHTTWIATSILAMAGEGYAEFVDKGFQALIKRPFSDWADSQIAWALDCLGRAGFLKTHPFIAEGLDELLNRQAPDGSWASEDGEAFRVSGTIEVIKVLKCYGLLSGNL